MMKRKKGENEAKEKKECGMKRESEREKEGR